MTAKRATAILALLLAFYLAIHILALNNKPFFGDEIWFSRMAQDIGEAGFPRPQFLAHFPLFGYALASSFRLFGFSEASARLVPMAFGLLSLIVVYKIGALISSREKVGLLAVLILVLSKIFMSYTVLVDMDGSVVAFFLLLETYMIFRYLERGGSLIPASMVLGVGLLFKIGTVLVPFIVLLFMRREKRLQAASGILLGLGVFISVYVAYFTRYSWGFWTGFLRPVQHFLGSAGGTREPLLKFLGVFFWNSSFPLVLILGYSILRALSDKNEKRRFMAYCALVALVAYSLVSHKMERYFVPIVPMAAILAADYVMPMLEKRLLVAGASAVLGLAYFSLLNTYSLSFENIAISALPLALVAVFLRGEGAEKIVTAVFGLYVGFSVFSMAVYATHDYVINECEGQREAAGYLLKNLKGENSGALLDSTIEFYMGRDYVNPSMDFETGIRDGKIRYYAQCRAWPNFYRKTPIDAIADRYSARTFHIKSIKIQELEPRP